MSEREKRWLVPPPHRTAYFWSARSLGNVLRVSSTRARVPANASTQRDVAVATPERWDARLRAVRSAVSRERVGPETRITTSPALTRVPSGTRSCTSTPGPAAGAAGPPVVPPPRRIDPQEHERGDAEAGHHPFLASREDPGAVCI